MNEDLIKTLIELKLRYFGSKFFSLENFINFNRIVLPQGVTPKDLNDWANEKQLYLAQSKLEIEGVKESYKQIIIDRLDSACAIQEQIMLQLQDNQSSKDLETIAKTMDKVAKMQDEAMVLLKVDAYATNIYEKNKTSTENLLKENSQALV